MLKINLEKELIKQNKSVVTARELLMINEADKLAAVQSDYEILQRAGMTRAADEGKQIQEENAKMLKETERFPADRVFHISQIEKLCNRYVLKFLPASFYKGEVDPALAGKIVQAEAAYYIRISAVEYGRSRLNELMHRLALPYFDLHGDRVLVSTAGRTREPEVKANAYIVAPAESFELQSRPVDPLFFYKINDQYYLLLHKWGNDLSLTRRITKSRYFTSVIVAAIVMVIALTMPQIWTAEGAANQRAAYFIFRLLIPGGLATLLFFGCAKAEPGKYTDPYVN